VGVKSLFDRAFLFFLFSVVEPTSFLILGKKYSAMRANLFSDDWQWSEKQEMQFTQHLKTGSICITC